MSAERPFALEVHMQPFGVVVEPKGVLGQDNEPALRMVLDVVPGGHRVVVDLAETDFVGLEAMTTLADTAIRLRREGGAVEVRNADERARRLAQACHCDHLVELA